MPLTLDHFWNLLAESGLLKPEELQKLADATARAQGGAPPPDKIVKYLINKAKISAYQAKILLGGRSGPFVYGEYQIYDRIESGRLAGIFRAVHMATRHPVCLFFLSGAAATDPEVLADWAHEAATNNRLSVGHPHLFRCYHLVDEGTYKFIVVEDLKGRRVERLLATDGALTVVEACRITRQAALGLARLHAMGQAYSEFRPANIWLDANDQAKLLLFPLDRDPMTPPLGWLAKARDKRGEMSGKVPNEANYIAPELIGGDSGPDARSDLYSLGCTLYQMLTNAPPFAGTTLTQKLEQHLNETPRPLDQVNPQVPAALSKLVGYLMAKDPDLRYQKAESVVEGLLAHIPPEVAQTALKPPSRASQKYEKWLSANDPLTAAEARQAAVAADAATRAQEAAEVAAAEALEVAAAAPSATPAPMHVTPVAAIPMAAPVMAVAIPAGVAVPMGMPVAGTAIPMAAVAVPVGDGSAMPHIGTAPGIAIAAPVFPAGAAQFPSGAAQFPTGAAQFPTAPFAVPQAFDGPAVASPVASGGNSLGERARLARRRKKVVSMTIASLVFVAVGTIAGLHFAGVFDVAKLAESLTSTPQPMPEPGKTATQTSTAPTIDDEPAAPSEPIVGLDDGIWASPTSGKPLDLKYLALGMQAIAALRPADIVKHPEGKLLLAPEKSLAIENLAGSHPLGTMGHWVQNTLPTLCGMPLKKIEQVIIGWPESGGEAGTIAVVARLAEPVDEAALINAWGNPEPMEAGEEKFFKRDALGYYLPKAEAGRVVVIAPAEEIQEAISGSVVLWAMPEPEKLLQSTDSDRHFTFLMPTRFLETAGRGAFEGRGARLQSPINWLLRGSPDSEGNQADAPKAVAVSAHFAPDGFFAEARLFDSAANIDSAAPAEPIRDRVRQIPKAVKLFKADLLLTPFSKAVLIDLDDKVKAWEQETRFGAADKQVVVRSYLPTNAALHLALGTHLCMLESLTGGMFVQGPTAPAGGGAPAGNLPQTAADKLKKVTSLSFPRNTLEVSMQLLAEDLGVPVVIMGTDLQLEGITKNQSFGLEEKDKPAVEIFKTIFAKANPDGKLVYIIKPDESGTETIYVTTRAAVAKRGDKLPPEFEKK